MNRLDLTPILFRQYRSKSTHEFRSHDLLVQRAKENPPRKPSNVVSDFASWVFDLCHPKKPSQLVQLASLEMGSEGEKRIQKYRKLNRNSLPKFRPPCELAWSIDYEDPLDDSREYFVSTKLKVNGMKLAGRPDLVLRRNGTRNFMIVERKVTSSSVPPHGWPNLQVQLWCYRWLNRWRRSDHLFLVGEVWNSNYGELSLSTQIPRWDDKDIEFDRRCRELFEIYGGTVS